MSAYRESTEKSIDELKQENKILKDTVDWYRQQARKKQKIREWFKSFSSKLAAVTTALLIVTGVVMLFGTIAMGIKGCNKADTRAENHAIQAGQAALDRSGYSGSVVCYTGGLTNHEDYTVLCRYTLHLTGESETMHCRTKDELTCWWKEGDIINERLSRTPE